MSMSPLDQTTREQAWVLAQIRAAVQQVIAADGSFIIPTGTGGVPSSSDLTAEITRAEAAEATISGDLATHEADHSNPHVVTAAQVGNTTAQWNANQLQGLAITTVAPLDGQVLVWSAALSQLVWVDLTPGTILSGFGAGGYGSSAGGFGG